MTKQSIIEQWKRLEKAGQECLESTKFLIEAAQKIDPNIKTREEALKLSDYIRKLPGYDQL